MNITSNLINSAGFKGEELKINNQGINPGAEAENNPASFASMLEKQLTDVNELVNTADKKAMDLAVGRSENLHEAMIASEKAETALKFIVQMRNKAMEAYHEVMRMQV
jgi:flagellar hook-basal body complex protein FliE